MEILSVTSFATTITIVGMGVVFSGLILINLAIKLIPRLISLRTRYVEARTRRTERKILKDKEVEMTADVAAAISMALHLYLDDSQETFDSKITIKRVSRNYSPWSSKIYGLNNVSYHNQK